jgi:hypothetical protein
MTSPSIEKKDWRLSVEAARPGAAPVRKVMFTPGPVDLRAYEVTHEVIGGPWEAPLEKPKC